MHVSTRKIPLDQLLLIQGYSNNFVSLQVLADGRQPKLKSKKKLSTEPWPSRTYELMIFCLTAWYLMLTIKSYPPCDISKDVSFAGPGR